MCYNENKGIDYILLNDLLLDHVHDNVTIIDNKGILLRASKSCEHNFKFCGKDFIGKPIAILEEKGVFSPSVSLQVLRKKTKITTVQPDAEGILRPTTGVPIFDSQNNILYVVCFGAWDFHSLEELRSSYALLEDELNRCTLEARYLRVREMQRKYVTFDSESTKHLGDTIAQVATYNPHALITGPSGVGKSFYARMLHDGYSNGPFIEFNCAASSLDLIEAEIFGLSSTESRINSYTDSRIEGAIDLAKNGTLYISEIECMPTRCQLRLANFIRHTPYKNEVKNNTSTTRKPRIIGATNYAPKELLSSGKLREELYYVLKPVQLPVPPLKDRRADIKKLISHFLSKKSMEYGLKKTISQPALERLLSYSWPGNIRELISVVESLLLYVPEEVIQLSDLPDEILSSIPNGNDIYNFNLKTAMELYEKRIVLQAYGECKTTVGVAKALGISQPSAARKLSRYKN